MHRNISDLESVFANGRLPLLVYANRQEYNEKKKERPVHSHESLCELLLVYQGSGIYNVNHESYEISEGDLLFYNAGEMHEVISHEDTEIGTYCLGFSGLRLKGLPENHMIEKDLPYVRHSGGQFRFLSDMAEQILERNRHNASDFAVIQLLAASMLIISREIPMTRQKSSVPKNVTALSEMVKSYISAHYKEPVTIKDIADSLGFSPDYISHGFKNATGYSPMEYLIRCRIGYAETLLISGDYPVSYVAREAGYENVSYFQTVFKKIVGITPRRYRMQYLESLHGERNQM